MIPKKREKQRYKHDLGGERIIPDIVSASKRNDLDGVKYALRENPACINDVDSHTGMSALHWACANRNMLIYEELLKHPQINLIIKNIKDEEPADLALQSGARKILEDLHAKLFPQDHLPEDQLDVGSNISIFNRENE